MRLLVPLMLVLTAFVVHAESPQRISNRLIDYDGFADNVSQVRALRASRRVSEADFIRMAREPGTVVLDARSARLYELRHVAGAVNLDFTEFTTATLAKLIPTRDARILIYCNNNFVGAPESLPTKHIASALNVSTFVSLFAYGYRNVYELGPVIDVARSKIGFTGSEVRSRPGD